MTQAKVAQCQWEVSEEAHGEAAWEGAEAMASAQTWRFVPEWTGWSCPKNGTQRKNVEPQDSLRQEKESSAE